MGKAKGKRQCKSANRSRARPKGAKVQIGAELLCKSGKVEARGQSTEYRGQSTEDRGRSKGRGVAGVDYRLQSTDLGGMR